MFQTFFVILLGQFLQASALANSDLCADINNRRFQLEIHAMNLANAISTRTPEGGAYKRKFLKDCLPSGCLIAEDRTTKLVFQPGHPDANAEGYVEYPNMDLKAELVRFEATFGELVTIAGQKKCGMELTHIDGALLITYSHPNVKSDFLIHGVDGNVIWKRMLSDGDGHTVLLNEHMKK